MCIRPITRKYFVQEALLVGNPGWQLVANYCQLSRIFPFTPLVPARLRANSAIYHFLVNSWFPDESSVSATACPYLQQLTVYQLNRHSQFKIEIPF